ncbi:MAG: ATP synthase F1 subunit gamma [Candidatus Vogelbacteria bacterium]|nr:ATP synthase F1 subunit gamma [Candidatus Vogelbacteria bacterium]
MESLQSIKSRLRAVKNIGKITKTMEVVAATKMRRAQEVALASRNYSWESLKLLLKMTANSPKISPLTEERKINSTLIVVISSDRGMAGSFNAQIFKAVDKFMRKVVGGLSPDYKFKFFPIGKKSISYCRKNGFMAEDVVSGIGDVISVDTARTISAEVIAGFTDKKWDRVVTISANFRTTLVQDVLIRQILPLSLDSITETIIEIVPEYGRYSDVERVNLKEMMTKNIDYIFEPSSDVLLDELIPHLIKMQFYHLMLEANASEHSARRVAMKSASDNASDVSNSLERQYNKARQSGITKELIEITSTQSALQ